VLRHRFGRIGRIQDRMWVSPHAAETEDLQKNLKATASNFSDMRGSAMLREVVKRQI
jgi:hypothetical protein